MGGVWSWLVGEDTGNPTMNDIEQHLKQEPEATEAAKCPASEATEDAEKTYRDGETAEQKVRQDAKDVGGRAAEAQNARESADEAERDRKMTDMHAQSCLQEEAQRQAEEIQQARTRAIQAEQEKHQAEEDACRSREEAQQARDDLRRGAHPDIWPTLEQFESTKLLYGYTPDKVHIAVAGISGSGKSSIVNSLRGVSPQSLGAARTGVVETTKSVARYPDPSKPLLWYDVPGAGTLSVSAWDYFNDQGLFIFDAIIVCFGDRFCATDIAILKACKKYCIPAYIVRTKSDQHVRNMMEEKVEDWDNHSSRESACKKYAEATRQSVAEGLAHADLPDQDVFLISRTALLAITAKDKGKKKLDVIFDEEKLMQEMVGDGIRRRFKQTPAWAVILNQIRNWAS